MASLVATSAAVALARGVDLVQFGTSVIHVRCSWVLAYIRVVSHGVCKWIFTSSHIA